MVFASHPPFLPPVTLFTIQTTRLLKKKPKDQVLRKSPVLVVFTPVGDSVMMKSSCPVDMKALPEPTSKNCGSKKKTQIGRGFNPTSSSHIVLLSSQKLLTQALLPFSSDG
ncbi:hypothetical protein TB1_025523 [Malus domestica]